MGIGDINGDNIADFAATVLEITPSLAENSDSPEKHAVVRVFLGVNGTNPDFTVPTMVLEAAQPDYIFATFGITTNYRFAGVGDINKDTFSDMVLADNIGGSAHVYLGRALTNPAPTSVPPNTVEEFRFGLATPLLPGTSAPPTVTLPDQSSNPVPIQNTVSWTGATGGEGLANAQNLGDINGDRFDDFLLAGAVTSYILLGPINLTATANISAAAEITLDTSSYGRAANSIGDINGDGMNDLMFVRQSGANSYVTIIFGRVQWARHLDPFSLDPATVSRITIANNNEVVALNWTEGTETGHHADILVGASDAAYLFNGANILPGVFYTAANASVKFVRDTLGSFFNAHAINAGDVNGDGLDDLLFADGDSTAQTQAYLLLGRAVTNLLPGTPPTYNLSGNRDAFFPVGFVNRSVFALGDLNRDGYDDFAVGSLQETEDPNQGSIFIYYGSAAYKVDAVPDQKGRDTANIRILKHSPGQLTGGLAAWGQLNVTAADLNGDGKSDLIVGEPIRALIDTTTQEFSFMDVATRGTAYVFRSITERGSQLLLQNADVTLVGEREFDLFGSTASSPRLDLDRDGIDDLLIGAQADSS